MSHRLHAALPLSVVGLCLLLSTVTSQETKTVPLNDPTRPGCSQVYSWKKVFSISDYKTFSTDCASEFQGSSIITMKALYTFADIMKDRVKIFTEMDFFVTDSDNYCGIATLELTPPRAYSLRLRSLVANGGFKCNKLKSERVTNVVCYRVSCPKPTTTTTTTTLAPKVALTTVAVAAVVRMGDLGMSIDNEILLYRVLLGVFFLLVIVLIIVLIRTCAQLRRANTRHSISDGRSHVSIRRVTDAGLDQYSSMAGIGDTSSLTAPELYGSIARRKELNRERKAWLRDHACGGSHIGVPPSEDMNGLLPPHGSIHRTSISSLTHPANSESFSRVPGLRAAPGTYPVRPPASQLSRQNTGDSLHYRGLSSPPPMLPSPGINGHTNPMNRDDLEGHMV